MSKKTLGFLTIFVLFSFLLSGCYYFSARSEMNSAEKLISDLKGAGGPTLAPYEYCGAESYLEMAKMEASQGDWKHAKDFASRSKVAAEAGLSAVKKK